jgi:hypothetical protein
LSRLVEEPSATALEDASNRIESWLLESPVQLSSGEHAGGVAGRIDDDGQPEFVYLEATGYYLTTVAWCARLARSQRRSEAALERGRRAFNWLRKVTEGGALPSTRVHLSTADDDWRNAATFTFDLAMAARGVASLSTMIELERADELEHELVDHVRQISGDDALLASHAERGDGDGRLPARWSTLPGPHHAKAAAALLHLTSGVDERFGEACRRTIAHWSAAMQRDWPCEELHPMLYGLEGLLIDANTDTNQSYDVVESIFEQVLALQAPDGTLPPERNGDNKTVRSDVLAQALRVGALLRAEGRLPGIEVQHRLDALAGALLQHVRRDGAVVFSLDRQVPNAWCAMFASQALRLHSGGHDAEAVSRSTRELLV